jgi:type II secretory pathway pseudopilin PulG
MTSAIPRTRRRKQAGYTLLMVIFLVASMLIFALAAAPNVLTEGRREKEAEMVWRGEQYERAVGLYYKKFGKYPTKIEDLTRETNGVRFLRQAYKDPMNKDDGTWRFIYVGANGQLIGSLRQTSLAQNALGLSNSGTASSFGGLLGLGQGQGQNAGTMNGPGGAAGAPGAAGGLGATGSQTNSAANPNPLESQPQMLSGDLIGGNIIGVGSKIKKPSLRIYKGGDTYQQWEFIWNPVGQLAVPGQTPLNPNGISPGATNGVNPNATNPNAVTPTGMNPNGTNPPGTDGQQQQQTGTQPPAGNPPPNQ